MTKDLTPKIKRPKRKNGEGVLRKVLTANTLNIKLLIMTNLVKVK